jgi:hypothetical protein
MGGLNIGQFNALIARALDVVVQVEKEARHEASAPPTGLRSELRFRLGKYPQRCG